MHRSGHIVRGANRFPLVVTGSLAGVSEPVVADLLAFIDASPSPYHAVAEAARRLASAGFVEVDETASWSGSAGPGFVRRGGSLVGWGSGGELGFRVVGAHTDSPNLRIKPRPDSTSAGWQQLGVEIYGGACSTPGSIATSGCRGGWGCAPTSATRSS